MAKKKKVVKKIKEVTFEQALGTLQEIVTDLEDGELPLEDSLEKYELGIHLLKKCHDSLNQAERKIEILTGIDSEGNPITQDYDHDEADLSTKAAKRSKRRSSSNKDLGSSKSTDKPEKEEDPEIDSQGQLF